jgi:hypothetical protein
MPLQSGPEAGMTDDDLLAGGKADAHTSPEQRLAIAVIVAAVADASGRKGVNESASSRALNRSAAIAWFRDGGDDFKEICALAGLEPSFVRDQVLAYLSNGDRLPRRGSALAGRKPSGSRQQSIALIAQRAAVSPQSVRNVMTSNGKASAAMSRHIKSVMCEMGVAA